MRGFFIYVVLKPPFLHRCAGGGGDEYRHSQHRHGVWSQYGRCIFMITAPLNVANCAWHGWNTSEVGYLARVGVCDRMRKSRANVRHFVNTVLKKGKKREKNVKASVPKHIIAILLSVSAFAAVCCCIWIQNTHSLAHSDAQPRLRARRAACMCVCVCVCVCSWLLHVVKPRWCNFVDTHPLLLLLSHLHAVTDKMHKTPASSPNWHHLVIFLGWGGFLIRRPITSSAST